MTNLGRFGAIDSFLGYCCGLGTGCVEPGGGRLGHSCLVSAVTRAVAAALRICRRRGPAALEQPEEAGVLPGTTGHPLSLRLSRILGGGAGL